MSRENELREKLPLNRRQLVADYRGRERIRAKKTAPSTVTSPLRQVRAIVIFYREQMHYGFLADADGDIFFHVSVLEPLGRKKARVGNVLDCEISTDEGLKKVMRVKRVHDRTGSLTVHGLSGWQNARFLWLQREKGFGFFSLDDDSPWIFVHVDVLAATGFSDIKDDAVVQIRHVARRKGPAVVDIREVK